MINCICKNLFYPISIVALLTILLGSISCDMQRPAIVPDTPAISTPEPSKPIVTPPGPTAPAATQPPKEVPAEQTEQDTATVTEVTPKEKLSLDIIVSVPYWTEGEVYLGTVDNPAFAKLDRINDTTYRKNSVELEDGIAYYYSLGTADTKEIFQERSFTETPLIRDAVVNWQNQNRVIAKPGFQKGVTFGGMLWREDQLELIDQSIQELAKYGVDHIIVIPDWFVFPDIHGTEIKPFFRSDGEFPNPTNWITPTLSDVEVKGIITEAKKNGIKVVLKPHVDPIDFGMKGGSSRGALSPNNWDSWFESYHEFIIHYAKLAEETGVEMLVIGTELDTATIPGNPEGPTDVTNRWRGIISDVRQHYSGLLTYSVSCHGDCGGPDGIEFWDSLDYIGVEPYFGLTDKNDPTIEEMKLSFDSKFEEYFKPLYERYGKPIILTETNCYSFDGVNRDPIAGNIQQISSQASSVNDLPLDHQEQADYYEALFQSLENKDWIQGVYWWAWYLDSSLESSDGWQLTDRFDPFVRKIAGQVLKKWYLNIEN